MRRNKNKKMESKKIAVIGVLASVVALTTALLDIPLKIQQLFDEEETTEVVAAPASVLHVENSTEGLSIEEVYQLMSLMSENSSEGEISEEEFQRLLNSRNREIDELRRQLAELAESQPEGVNVSREEFEKLARELEEARQNLAEKEVESVEPEIFVEPENFEPAEPEIKIVEPTEKYFALIVRGNELNANGEHELAVEVFRKAIDLQPETPKAYFLLADTLELLDRFTEAGPIRLRGEELQK